MKKAKGITLIALVITIIVLLILAGVALATLTGQGNIIGNAENAVGKYNNSVSKEQEILNEIEKYLINYGYGGNEEIEDQPNPPIEGEITITPSTTEWTSQDIKVSVTWPSNIEGLTKQISIDNGNTWNTYTGELTISSNCIVKIRLIDSANQEVKTASLTINNIDKNEPIVTATQSSLTITEGDSYEISNYFTINANGEAPITNTTYSVTNTSSLGVGTHTVTCTVTKANGLSTTGSMTVVVNEIVLPTTNVILAERFK